MSVVDDGRAGQGGMGMNSFLQLAALPTYLQSFLQLTVNVEITSNNLKKTEVQALQIMGAYLGFPLFPV